MTEQEIEIERLKVERDRLEFDKEKARQDQKFWVRNFATVLTTVLSLAAVLVTLGQVWIAKISKDREIEIAASQKDKELSLTQAQKEKELTLLAAQQEREWNLSAAKFISEHSNVIFGKDKEQREQIAKVMIVTFPPSITDVLFQKLENSTDAAQGQSTWRTARQQIIPKIDEPQQVSSNIAYRTLNGTFVDLNTNQPIKGARISLTSTQRPSLYFQTETDAQGKFQLDRIEAGPFTIYTLSATHQDYGSIRQFVTVAGPQTTVSLTAKSIKTP
jgi:hypothetical protein